MGEAVEPPAPRSKARWLVWPFAALGVVTAIAIVWLAIELSNVFPAHAPAIVAAGHAGGETLAVGNVTPLEGTDLIAIEIRALDDGSTAGSSYSNDDRRNLLFLDRKTGLSRRVLPGNATRITDIAYFPAQKDAASHPSTDEVGADGDFTGKTPPPVYYLLTIERQSKNGDKLYDLLAGTLATGKQGMVMSGLSGMDQSGMIDATHLGVVVRQGGGLYYRVVDIPALKQVESHKIEIG